MKNRFRCPPGLAVAVTIAFLAPTSAHTAPRQTSSTDIRPNIVLMFPDNLGIGEVGAYGGARGVPTPNIDQIAQQGMRLTNFNVEYSCVVSRIALLTGRYAVRTGEGAVAGMTLWEITIAEALRSVGYATALFGKWHVGGDDWEGRREPTQQGFDEWWGIPGTSHTAQFTSFEGFDADRFDVPHIWQGPADRVTRYKPMHERTGGRSGRAPMLCRVRTFQARGRRRQSARHRQRAARRRRPYRTWAAGGVTRYPLFTMPTR